MGVHPCGSEEHKVNDTLSLSQAWTSQTADGWLVGEEASTCRPPSGANCQSSCAWGWPSLTVSTHRCSPFQDLFRVFVYLQTTLFAAEKYSSRAEAQRTVILCETAQHASTEASSSHLHTQGPPWSEYRQHWSLLQSQNESPPGYMLIRKGLSVFLSDSGLFYGTLQLQQRKLNPDWVNLFLSHIHTYTQRDVLFQWINKSIRHGIRHSWIQVLKISPESSLLASSIFLWVGFTLKQVFPSQSQDGCHESQAYRLCSKLNQKKAFFPHYFLMGMLRHNWCTVNCTHLKCTIWWILTSTDTCKFITTLNVITILSIPLQKCFLVPLCNLINLFLLPPLSIGKHWSASYHYKLDCMF